MAEKIVEFIAKKHKKDIKKFYDEIFDPISKNYETLYDFFEDYTLGNVKLDISIPKSLVKEFDEIIKQRIKPKEISIGGSLEIKSYKADGVEFIKKNLIEEIKKYDDLSVRYLGAGKYDVAVSGEDYKKAEKILKDFTENIEKRFKNNEGTAEFKRKEKWNTSLNVKSATSILWKKCVIAAQKQLIQDHQNTARKMLMVNTEELQKKNHWRREV